jgi:hypothetical protein
MVRVSSYVERSFQQVSIREAPFPILDFRWAGVVLALGLKIKSKVKRHGTFGGYIFSLHLDEGDISTLLILNSLLSRYSNFNASNLTYSVYRSCSKMHSKPPL